MASSFTNSTITKCYSRDQIKKKEMAGVCSMYGREERCMEGFGGAA
jgi:hypothetical protein